VSAAPVETSGTDVLAESDCLALVNTAAVGRVVYSDRALPVIVPVNFVLIDGDVVLRTSRRSRLGSGAPGNVVLFEVDHIDPATRTGWSVVLTGRMEAIEDAEEIARLDELDLPTWTTGPADRYIRLRPEIINGLRLRAPN
jgi:nitroimidazol reductase NimA-like FMN-containing flavoprotein (pyridoxamine 5'-phosphate oxidase superfamily)